MDDSTLTLLSRYLDGDLSAEEASRLEQRLATEPELEEELRRLAAVSAWVGELAEEEEPPDALDALVAPLRFRPAPRPAVRPAFRWLAAAACVVLGVAVGVEVAREHPPAVPRPSVREQEPRGADRGAATTPFQLQPLPSAADDEDRPVGAAERLLASPPPEPVPEEMPALEPVGPLSEPPGDEVKSAAEERKRVLQSLRGLRSSGGEEDAAAAAEAPAPEPGKDAEGRGEVSDASRLRELADVEAEAPVAAPTPAPARESERRVTAPTAAATAERSAPSFAGHAKRADAVAGEAVSSGLGSRQGEAVTLELRTADGTRSATAVIHDSLPPGSYRVVIRVDATGRVVDIRPADKGVGGWPAGAIAGLRDVVVFEGVAEGEHDGVLSVPASAAQQPSPEE